MQNTLEPPATPTPSQSASSQPRDARRRWIWASLLTAVTVLLSYIDNQFLRLRGEASDIRPRIVFFQILAIVFPLVVTVTVLFYHLLGTWSRLSSRIKAAYILAFILVSVAIFAGGYGPFGFVAVAISIPPIVAPVLLYLWFPRSGKTGWGVWRFVALLTLFAAVLSVGGCAATQVTPGPPGL